MKVSIIPKNMIIIQETQKNIYKENLLQQIVSNKRRKFQWVEQRKIGFHAISATFLERGKCGILCIAFEDHKQASGSICLIVDFYISWCM